MKTFERFWLNLVHSSLFKHCKSVQGSNNFEVISSFPALGGLGSAKLFWMHSAHSWGFLPPHAGKMQNGAFRCNFQSNGNNGSDISLQFSRWLEMEESAGTGM